MGSRTAAAGSAARAARPSSVVPAGDRVRDPTAFAAVTEPVARLPRNVSRGYATTASASPASRRGRRARHPPTVVQTRTSRSPATRRQPATASRTAAVASVAPARTASSVVPGAERVHRPGVCAAAPAPVVRTRLTVSQGRARAASARRGPAPGATPPRGPNPGARRSRPQPTPGAWVAGPAGAARRMTTTSPSGTGARRSS
jgi:hypothetical protein